MEHRGPYPRSQDFSIIPILSRINSIPRTESYFFKIHSCDDGEITKKLLYILIVDI